MGRTLTFGCGCSSSVVQLRFFRVVAHFSPWATKLPSQLQTERWLHRKPGVSAAASLCFEWGICVIVLCCNLLPVDHCFSQTAVSDFDFSPEFCWKDWVLQLSPLLSTWGYSFLKAVKDSPLIWCHTFYLFHTFLNISGLPMATFPSFKHGRRFIHPLLCLLLSCARWAILNWE